MRSERIYATLGVGLTFMGVTVSLLVPAEQRASAYPSFSRKYNIPCARCHSMVSRLTPFGYAFARAGFRTPGNEQKPYSFSNSVSFLTEVDVQRTRDTGDSDITMPNFDIALATSIEKNWAFHARYSISKQAATRSGFAEVWAQYNSAPRGTFWSVRVGQLPVLDGYQLLGARNITLTDPMLFGGFGPLTGDGQGNLSVADVERGVQIGYASKNLYARASWLNGVSQEGAGNVSLPGNRGHDFVLQTEYLIGREGSAVGGFYYLGKTPFPDAGFNNNFQRSGLFATYGRVLKPGESGIPDYRFELNGGLLWGRDRIDAAGTSANSFGTVLEANLYCRNRTAYAIRYDTARLSDVVGTPTTGALTFAILHLPNKAMRLGLEYRKQYSPNDDTLIASIRLFY